MFVRKINYHKYLLTNYTIMHNVYICLYTASSIKEFLQQEKKKHAKLFEIGNYLLFSINCMYIVQL